MGNVSKISTVSPINRAARVCVGAFSRDRAASAAVWFALSIPMFLAAGGVALDVSQAALARQTVQLAADLGARAGAMAYGVNVDAEKAANAAANVVELNGVVAAGSSGTRSWNAGTRTLTAGRATISFGLGVTDPTYTAVSVTVQKPVPMAFANLIGTSASRTVSANSVAEAWNLPAGGAGAGAGSGACVLALNASAASAIKVDNMGRIVATNCNVFANSIATGTAANAAIYLNSGTISATAISTPGKICLSNSGSNTISPAIANNSCVSPGAAAQADPFAGLAIPSPSQTGCAQNAAYGACCIPPVAGTVNGVASTATNVVNQSYTSWQATPRTFSTANGGVFCGNTAIGGNGISDQFAPGIYYVINGNLTFNNSNVTLANGVSFVLLGKNGGNPGAISWTNYSNTYTLTAPSSGPTANILFWQTCPGSGTAGTNAMAGGSTLTMTGAFYAKCGALNLSNNIQMNAAAGSSLKVVANTIAVMGSAAINAAATAAAITPANTALVR